MLDHKRRKDDSEQYLYAKQSINILFVTLLLILHSFEKKTYPNHHCIAFTKTSI